MGKFLLACRGLTQSTAFRVALVWALVFGTWNRSGYSALHFEASLWQDFASSPAFMNFDPQKLNVVATAFAVGIIGIVLTFGNIICKAAGRTSPATFMINLGLGLVMGLTIFVFLSGNSHEYHFAPLLWLLFVGGMLVFVWWLFYKWATELMGPTLFWFAAIVVSVGVLALVYTFQWRVNLFTGIQVIIAIALSVGAVLYPMIRRRATGTGSTFTSYHGADDGSHGSDAAQDGHHA